MLSCIKAIGNFFGWYRRRKKSIIRMGAFPVGVIGKQFFRTLETVLTERHGEFKSI